MSSGKQKRKKESCNEELPVEKKKIKKEPAQVSPKAVVETTPYWDIPELLAEQQDLSFTVAQNVIQLLEDGNTIPFIARYRRDATQNMTPERLRDVKETYDEICLLKNKIGTVIKTLEKTKVLNEALDKSVRCSRSIEELEYVYAPYKPGSKRTLAQKAKDLGLEEPALAVLNNSKNINLEEYIVSDKKDLQTLENVENGIVNIIASVLSTDTEMLTLMRNTRTHLNILVKSKKIIHKEKTKPNPEENKFDTYSDFEIPMKYIKPHQVLALNRGENLKILSIKIVVPEKIFHEFKNFCQKKWIYKYQPNNHRNKMINIAIEEAYKRFVEPLIIREIRSELKVKAEKASCEVFSSNLKHLLLVPPLKGKIILGMDPGFSNGCKLAVVATTGTLLDHATIFPFKNSNKAVEILQGLLLKHSCNLIALGNGTACRQTEEWLAELIKKKPFNTLDIQYTIVNEDGASIYSCSTEAKKEFPTLDPNIISAVSLARRIQEPLAELIKIEPKHLGVGMYQHDLKKKQLKELLDEIVSECVSFVGVDLNTASECLLRHIAGLSSKRASQILAFREKNGPFLNRKDLLKVSGIGERIFQQCAGFLRVNPLGSDQANDFYKTPNSTKLDCTYIHPESYEIAGKLMKKLNLKVESLGKQKFIDVVKAKMPTLNLKQLSEEFNCTESTLQLILDVFSKPLNHDLRDDYHTKPLFKKEVKNINDLIIGDIITGRITNVTNFGCFVDIGVGINGLIHISKTKGTNLQIGNRVEVKILNIEKQRNRIGLEFSKLI